MDEPFWGKLEASGELTPELEEELLHLLGDRGTKAIEGVRSSRVKRYLDFFVVEGRRPYVVEDGLCTCDDYLFRGSRTGEPCWHLLAVKIALLTGQYQRVDAWFHEGGL